jgi:hypothetical protein
MVVRPHAARRLYRRAARRLSVSKAHLPELQFGGVKRASYRAKQHDVRVNIRWLDAATSGWCNWCATAAVFGVLAHELAHATQRARLLRPQRTPRERWVTELEADESAGFAIGGEGLSLAGFIRLLRTLPITEDHPPLSQRIEASRRGYARACAHRR